MLAFPLILFGIMEAGRLMNVQEILTDAAREGARFAVTPIAQTSNLPTDDQIKTVIQGLLDAGAITGANVRIQRPVSIVTGPVTTEYTRVRVDCPYRSIIGTLFFLRTLSLWVRR